jgi:hypothetical protein
MTIPGADLDERFTPAVDMIGRTGARQFQIRYCEEEEPTVWMAAARWDDHWEVAASLDPVTALFRLCEQIVDGGTCMHCHRPTGFHVDFHRMPWEQLVCWYSYDPELKTFRRSCEGVTP